MPTTPPIPHARASLIQGLARNHPYLVVVEAGLRVCWVSDSVAAHCGDAPIGQPLDRLFASDEPIDAAWTRLFDRRRLICGRFDLLGANGERIPIEAGALSLSGSGRDAVAMLRPISERTELESQFHGSVDPLRAILDSSPDTVLAIDPNGFITYASPKTELLYGHPASEMVGKPSALLARHDLRLVFDPVPEGHVCGYVFELRHPDGNTRAMSVSSNPLRLADGSDAGIVVFVRDVTQRRDVERELERKNAELEHYVNAVSHDLRSPLASISGFAGLLREMVGSHAEASHFLDRIDESSRTMGTLIDHLLELSRIGRTPIRKSLVDPRAVVDRLRAELKPRLERQGVELRLPDSAPLVLCDRTHLYQIYANLVGNALDHMGDCPDPHIEIEVEETSSHHALIVRDNGCGIDPSRHERIFEIFESQGPGGNGKRGAGVGLAIVKKIAEGHGGSVRVISRAGHGAVFEVSLPRS
jgi:PAS domain S-box-containing protein